MNKLILKAAAGILLLLPLMAQADAVSELTAQYQSQGASGFSESAGADFWSKEYEDPKSGKMRSCTSCHSADLTVTGKHARTGKKIKPLAPSVNPKRLTDTKKIEKWFKRNCKWTLGRECTPQEKGDVLAFIKSK
jgi:cytochrome c553